MKVGVDLDGVVVDFHKPFIEQINKLYGKSLTKEMWTDYNFSKSGILPSELWEHIHKMAKRGDFYKMEPIEGSLEGLEKLSEHSIHIITHRLYKSREDAVKWLDKYKVDYQSISFARKKGSIAKTLGLDLMIEDTCEGCDDLISHGVPVILLNQPWNKDCNKPYVYNANNWNSIIERINYLEEIKESDR